MAAFVVSIGTLSFLLTAMRVNLQSSGCRLNEAELQGWASDFEVRGYVVTRCVEEADVVVVNTCAVTGEAGRKSRQMIRRARKDNPRAKLVVSGCHATLEPHKTLQIEGVDLVVPNRDKDALVAAVHAALRLPDVPAADESALFRRGRCRAFIKVQDGCRWRCRYCIVTVARGAERSMPVGRIVEQINRQVDCGVREVVLTGVHLGGYGDDIGSSLYALTRSILADTGVRRLRFGSLEPWDLHEDFFSLFADERVMPHLHLPLQSGSDTVLKRMARRCRRHDFASLTEAARAAVAGFNITTDIIAGFPGESEAEWQESLDFVGSIGFGHVHVFPFSAREGTGAAGLPDKVPHAVIRRRARQLRQLSEQMRCDFMRQNEGRVCEVLLEEHRRTLPDGSFVCSGYTRNYLRVEYVTDHDVVPGGRIVRGRLAVSDGRAVLVSV